MSGGTTSAQEYQRIRMSTLYERDTVLRPCTDKSKRLFSLPGAIELQQQVLIAVLSAGGGWKITDWNDGEFVQNILGVDVMLDRGTTQQAGLFYPLSLSIFIKEFLIILDSATVSSGSCRQRAALWDLFAHVVSTSPTKTQNQ